MVDKKQKIANRIWNMIFSCILALYPLRHIWLGVELTDGAYSAGNYRFTEQINEMWLFATYLANVMGRFLSNLPGGSRLMGLNAYTALFISITAVAMYTFYVKVLKCPKGIAFLGEMLAISLCWCPTTILYNYLTYFFFNLAIIALYIGLVKEKRIGLFIAGIFLGLNVMVRFPNLAEAALILAVWYYGFLQRKRLKDVLQETGVCILGFLGGVGIVLLTIMARYGLQNYIDGIINLLNMPSDASDYSLYSMIVTVLWDYKASSRWLICMLVLVALGCAVSAVVYAIVDKRYERKIENASISGCGQETSSRLLQEGIDAISDEYIPEYEGIPFALRILGRLCFLLSILVMFRWWYSLGVFNVKYYTYESMFQWVAVFLIITIISGLWILFSKRFTRNQKLLSLILLVLLGVTPLGSNNHLYPNMNNMFLVFPYSFMLLWMIGKEIWEYRELETKHFVIALYPAKCMIMVFTFVLCMQCILFGAVFTFRDGMSGQKRDTKIEKNAILKGMVTNEQLAKSVEELTMYMDNQQLQDKELLLYGQIPATSYILNMPSAISTTWADLRSYGYETMVTDMQELQSRMDVDAANAPVIILGAGLDAYLRGNEVDMQAAELTEGEKAGYLVDQKLVLITDFMKENGYTRSFGNAKFGVYISE